MTAVKQVSSETKLSGKDKWLIGALLCLQIPFTVVFFPMAAVFVLTGILAPLGMMSFAVGTMPFSLAMKRKNAWQFGEVRKIEQLNPSVVAVDGV